MRPILITAAITELAKRYASTVFTGRAQLVLPDSKLNTLSLALVGRHQMGQYRQYVDCIRQKLPLLYHIKPEYYQQFHDRYFSGFNVTLGKKIKIGNENKAFHKHISAAMRYDVVRERDFLPFVKELGIKSCVYCNANYALSISDGDQGYGKFELDHYKAQSKFPYLCTNFYNLTPCCSNCNKYKLNADSEFCLYVTSHTELEQFKFELDPRSIIKYMLSQDPNKLKVKFKSHHHHDHGRLFKIDPTYEVLKDLAEEIIWKSKIYNTSYLKSLKDSFDRKFIGGNFYRFLLGNYDRPQDIHNRPLSKMSQDIARQLGLIE